MEMGRILQRCLRVHWSGSPATPCSLPNCSPASGHPLPCRPGKEQQETNRSTEHCPSCDFCNYRPPSTGDKSSTDCLIQPSDTPWLLNWQRRQAKHTSTLTHSTEQTPGSSISQALHCKPRRVNNRKASLPELYELSGRRARTSSSATSPAQATVRELVILQSVSSDEPIDLERSRCVPTSLYIVCNGCANRTVSYRRCDAFTHQDIPQPNLRTPLP